MNRSDEEIARMEEERMTRHITGSKAKETVAPKSPSNRTGNWAIHLIGLPTDQGAPVSVNIDGIVVFTSADDGKDVTKVVTHPIPNGGSSKITLNIPIMEFTTTKEYHSKSGENLKFQFTESGLATGQQTAPFN
eukprot:TRINITY_DN16256_c0_g1_i1.p1 TRINITY_DN16256_c0_g1~~TRINITY_DN16256_c0_g1_i1.p1  ORF type:complete len:134 (-),score=24.44 TRINITY_DN16256_c0_g1_i1:83-484(-)